MNIFWKLMTAPYSFGLMASGQAWRFQFERIYLIRAMTKSYATYPGPSAGLHCDCCVSVPDITSLCFNNDFESAVCHALYIEGHRFVLIFGIIHHRIFHHFGIHLITMCARLEHYE